SDTFSYLENGKFFYLSLKDEKESTKKHAQSLYESINETEFQIGNEKKHLKIDASLIIKKREETLIKTMKSAEIELDKAKVSEDNKIKSPHIRF
ncbi:MAG: hypothetical protein U9N42_02620, partial [Campylobacterota bacterium]|nr:hypothetical protein [Campylobacterota bacterium]